MLDGCVAGESRHGDPSSPTPYPAVTPPRVSYVPYTSYRSGPPSPEQLRRLSGADLSTVALAVLPSLPPGRVAQLSVALARLGHFDMQYKAVLVEHVVGRLYQVGLRVARPGLIPSRAGAVLVG